MRQAKTTGPTSDILCTPYTPTTSSNHIYESSHTPSVCFYGGHTVDKCACVRACVYGLHSEIRSEGYCFFFLQDRTLFLALRGRVSMGQRMRWMGGWMGDAGRVPILRTTYGRPRYIQSSVGGWHKLKVNFENLRQSWTSVSSSSSMED